MKEDHFKDDDIYEFDRDLDLDLADEPPADKPRARKLWRRGFLAGYEKGKRVGEQKGIGQGMALVVGVGLVLLLLDHCTGPGIPL